jgi:hypothetical protein
VDRANRYEAAFEEYLRQRGLPYIAVDESRRAILAGGGPLKSLDFIVYGTRGCRLLVDVKGRKYPGKSGDKPRTTWECWSTQDDVTGLTKWQEIFGDGFDGAFVFMYELGPAVVLPADTPDLWEWKGKRYLLRAVLIDEYVRNMRSRSPNWGTVSLPVAAFRECVKPLWELTHLRGFMERANAGPANDPSR